MCKNARTMHVTQDNSGNERRIGRMLFSPFKNHNILQLASGGNKDFSEYNFMKYMTYCPTKRILLRFTMLKKNNKIKL
jgi:hypothetical protein